MKIQRLGLTWLGLSWLASEVDPPSRAEERITELGNQLSRPLACLGGLPRSPGGEPVLDEVLRIAQVCAELG